MLGFCGEPSGRAGEVYARVEVLDCRLDNVEGSGSRDAVDDNLVPDFILPKTVCCRYIGSDGFLNGKEVAPEDQEGRSIVFGYNLDIVVGGELYSGNKILLNCRVNSIAYSKVVGSVWECCVISLNENIAVTFGQNRSMRLLILRGGRERGIGCSDRFRGSGNGREK